MPIDYKKYHPRWRKISYFIRAYRAKWKCEWCGAINGFAHPITKSTVVLTVAHLDHNIKNNSFFNLAALCQRCHLRYDKKQERRNKMSNKSCEIEVVEYICKDCSIKWLYRGKTGIIEWKRRDTFHSIYTRILEDYRINMNR